MPSRKVATVHICCLLDCFSRAAGYRLANGQLKNQQWVAPALNTTADGSLYFSILDLAKWDAVLYTDKLNLKSLPSMLCGLEQGLER